MKVLQAVRHIRTTFIAVLFASAAALAVSCEGDIITEELPDFKPGKDGLPVHVDQDMPVVYITTANGVSITSKTEYVKGNITFIDSRKKYSDTKVLESPMQIRGRGNTTWGLEKKPYKVKLDEKAKVFGMDKNRDWVLLANYSDKTLLRNVIAMDISRELEFSWTPDMIPVEVYVNRKYEGVYCICQQKEVANHRVDIGEDAVLFEMDKTHDEHYHFRSGVCKMPVNLIYPESPTDSVKKWARDYFTAFESALYGDRFTSPEYGYAKYIDVDSFIKYFIIEELSYNIDGKCCKSTFLTKEKDKKLEMYFVWDFDIAFGNCNYFAKYYPALNNGPTGFHTRDYLSSYVSGGVEYGGYGKGWYYRLFQDPAFVKKVKEKWNAMYPFLQTVPSLINEHVKEMGEAPVNRNFERWQILGKYVWPQPSPYPATYEEEISRLKEFYSARLRWLNNELNKL